MIKRISYMRKAYEMNRRLGLSRLRATTDTLMHPGYGSVKRAARK